MPRRSSRHQHVAQRGGGRGFTPTSVASLAAWFRADSIAGVADGATVASWTDQTGNGNTVTQGTEADKPLYKVNIINGYPVVRFVSNDYLQAVATGIPDGSAPFSIVAVASRGTGTANVLTMRSNGSTNGWILKHGNGSDADFGRMTTPGVKDYDVDGVWTAAATFYIQTAIMDSSSDMTFYRNGTSVGTSAHNVFNTATASLFRISSDNVGWDGDIAELLVYNAELSTANRQAIEAYLSNRYAITLS